MNRRALLLGFLTLPFAARLRPPAFVPAAPLSQAALILRADEALIGLAGGGMLTGTQARRFYEIMVERSVMLPATDPETWPVLS